MMMTTKRTSVQKIKVLPLLLMVSVSCRINHGIAIEHLRRGTDEVRNILGADAPVTDKDIEESLYYYYYDVEKTVNYLLSKTMF